MNLTSRQILLPILATAAVACSLSLAAQPLAPTETPSPSLLAPAQGTEIPCEGGVILDDGSAETGYGWVPSAIEGEYVQLIDTDLFPTRTLGSVCVCWLRTLQSSGETIDFEVVFYADTEGGPGEMPYAVVPASATVEPIGITETFVEVDVTGVDIPVGPSYLGVRWDPSVYTFFFVCTDTSEETSPVNVFFRDDRTPERIWTSVFESQDPIFALHKAIMVRARSGLAADIDIPALGAGGLAALALLLGGLGIRRVRAATRRSRSRN